MTFLSLLCQAAQGLASHSPSTQEGFALVVPATWPERQEHLTVWERSSIRFRLQQRCAAITSQVPCFTRTDAASSYEIRSPRPPTLLSSLPPTQLQALNSLLLAHGKVI